LLSWLRNRLVRRRSCFARRSKEEVVQRRLDVVRRNKALGRRTRTAVIVVALRDEKRCTRCRT
jgi:hypothetical protein